MASDHPPFKNPTIVEALCEIHFVPGARKVFDVNKPLLARNLIERDFPELELVPAQTIVLGVTGNPPPAAPTASVRFANTDRNRLIQIAASGEVVVFNVLKPYPGWPAFDDLIRTNWAALRDAFDPVLINRVALRYINVVAHTEAAPDISHWLKPTDQIPAGLLKSPPPSMSRIDIQTGTESRMTFVARSDVATPAQPYGATIIDMYHLTQAPLDHEEKLQDTLRHLHDGVWASFSSALTDQYKAHLDKI